MTYARTFLDYTPAPRAAGTGSWVTALIDEAPLAPTGAAPADDAWSTIDTLTLTPDSDPTQPATRTLTTNNATLPRGWYRVVFLDAGGDRDITEPVDYPPVGGIRPTLTSVGSINRARTDDGHGDTLGTFTSETRPTADDVEVLADLAANQVADSLGNNIPAEFVDRAQGAAALYAAALVESTSNSPREGLMKMWSDMADARITQLAVEIAEVGAGGQEGPGDNQLMPAYAFPPACPLPPVF